MRDIDSSALILLDRIMGLGSGGEQTAVLDDGHVSQILDINEIARRSLTLADTAGIFLAYFENTHGAGNSQLSTASVYNPGTTVATGSYPSVVPAAYDVWLLGVGAGISSGTATNFAEGCFSMEAIGNFGLGVDQAGAFATPGSGAVDFIVARWDAQTSCGGIVFLINEEGQSFHPVARRIPRGGRLQFGSDSTGAVVVMAYALLGFFPSGLGQDVAP